MNGTEQSSVVTTVTKPKHPGRVAQGHKLAALMKQKKQELLQNKDSEQPKELESVQHTVLSSHTLEYSGLGIITLIICISVYYLYNRKKHVEPSQTEAASVESIKKKKVYLE